MKRTKRINWMTYAKSFILFAGVCSAISGVWITFGLPQPAWSTDIARLDTQQVQTAIQATRADRRDLTNRLREIEKDLLSHPRRDFKNFLEQEKRNTEESLKELDEKLNELKQREIELGK